MKIIIASFQIAKWGGIIPHIQAKFHALKKMGHEVDIVVLHPNGITQKQYDKYVAGFEDGSYEAKLARFTEKSGYWYDETVKYWCNAYHGYFLPPSNRINVFAQDALEKWSSLVGDADVIMWNFMPTKNKIWGREGEFNYWWKFFDLPSKVKQVFIAHDAFFDIRASQISALRDKISLIECAHVAAYHCCENIGIPRTLLLNPRFLESGKMPYIPMQDRDLDFFAAHIFKPIKHIDDFIRAIPYCDIKSNCWVAGVGIEQSYMTAESKVKPRYVCNRKSDPDAKDEWLGRKIWDIAEEHGMEYIGLVSGDIVNNCLQNAKFAIDPSWSAHYAKYCRTHINGFIIEAMLNGCYPVLRDYSGLDTATIQDPIFDELRAVIIPWDATPKQFAAALNKASKMSPKKYRKDTEHNYQVVMNLFNAQSNMEYLLNVLTSDNVEQECEVGEDSENVRRITKETMSWFGVSLPIKWST